MENGIGGELGLGGLFFFFGSVVFVASVEGELTRA